MAEISDALNGRVPEDLLEQVRGQRDGIRLSTQAAEAFGRLSDDLEDRFGWRPRVNTAYRTVAQQNRLLVEGLTSVPGGKSEHGLARAADVGGLGGFAGRRYVEFTTMSAAHGWYQPDWATTWRPEPWHHEYDPVRDERTPGAVPAPISTEADMFTDEDRATLKALTAATHQLLRWVVPDVAVRRSDGRVAIVGPEGVRHLGPTEWQTLQNLGYRPTPGQEAMDDAPFNRWVSAHGGYDARVDDVVDA